MQFCCCIERVSEIGFKEEETHNLLLILYFSFVPLNVKYNHKTTPFMILVILSQSAGLLAIRVRFL